MNVAIINCDLDKFEKTNGANLIKNQININSEIIDITNLEDLNINNYDGFIVTGSHASFNEELVWIDNLKKYFIEIHNSNKPCLCICISMQILAEVFGGKAKKSNANEIGFLSIRKTDNDSKLLIGIKKEFMVYQYHNDIVDKVPKGAKITLENDMYIQGFDFDNFFCVQFHPEITPEICKYMSLRDGRDKNDQLNGISENYSIPLKVFDNFIDIVNNN